MAEIDSCAFVEALMAHIMEQFKIPKLQGERIIGPVLGMFIPAVFSAILEDDVRMVCPEFPLRKVGGEAPQTYQSTNIDWLLYSSGREQLVFLELKTTDTTYDAIQHKIYRSVIDEIKRSNSSFLVSDIELIMGRSQEHGKYAEVLRRARSDDRYRSCRKAKLIYLSPNVMKDAMHASSDKDALWLSFADLPENVGCRFSEEWKIIRKHLIWLDGQTRRSRNRGLMAGDGDSFGASV